MTGIAELVASGKPFALLYRPGSAVPDMVTLLTGPVHEVHALADIPLPAHPYGEASGGSHDGLALIPFRQVAERGFQVRDDGLPILYLEAAEEVTLPLATVIAECAQTPPVLLDGHFDLADREYAELVRSVIREEIGNGAGSNFVLHRSWIAQVSEPGPESLCAAFCRLVCHEDGAHWIFLVHTGTDTFLGASPERLVALESGLLSMTPISGTYRHPEQGSSAAHLLHFLGDVKESDELLMVLDEELKTMTRLCPRGVRARGPVLHEMSRLTHTGYLIEGYTDLDRRTLLREVLHAPTVTGSPIESACRVIARREPDSRGYYAGVAALFGRDELGAPNLDTAILIRTARVTAAGTLSLGVGATIVRHSDPLAEAEETRAKAAAVLHGFRDVTRPDAPARRRPTGTAPRVPALLPRSRSGEGLAHDPTVADHLRRRNERLSPFWLADSASSVPAADYGGRRIILVDAEDHFTAMLAYQLRSLGAEVAVHSWDPWPPLDDADLVVLGPGPGDPGDRRDRRIARLYALAEHRLSRSLPLVAVCLSHQIVATLLGLPLVRRDAPAQGTARDIDLFGVPVRVGFYNTFAALAPPAPLRTVRGETVEVAADPTNGQVHALRAPGLWSVQFHPESVLSADGPAVLCRTLADVLPVGEPR